MKTIAFYSYKGGTGKSLAAANFAVCLSRMGLNCALVDLDFDGPSAHTKFQQSPTVGFLNYILRNIDDEAWPLISHPSFKFKSLDEMPGIKDINISKELIAIKSKGKKRGEKRGVIHLIPAGDTKDEDYWDNALSPLLRRIFTIKMEDDWDRISESGLEECVSFYQNLKQKIADLEPNPKYLIVDLRSGALENAATIISAWADSVALLFSLNAENIEYTTSTWKKITEEKDELGENKKIEMIPVLCRVPSHIDFQGRVRLEDLFDKIDLKGKEKENLSILLSDPELELNEALWLGYHERPKNTRLSHAYVNLFEKLIKKEDIPEKGIANKIGLDPASRDEKKIFLYEYDRGAIINPNDNSRNVSFKVETFQSLLQGFKEGIRIIEEELTKEDVDNKKNKVISKKIQKLLSQGWFNECLKNAGLNCGEKFGDALKGQWRSENQLDETEKVRRWCNFDSDIGFGRFHIFPGEFTISPENIFEGKIYLRESFLTPAKDTFLEGTTEHIFCDFFTGYIQGVFNKILNGSVKVKHQKMKPSEFKEYFGEVEVRSDNCIFEVKKE